MEKYNLKNDLKVFGIEVKNFPEGIGEAFDKLVNMLTGEFDRSYYGIIEMTGNGVMYKATAEEKYDNEAEKYQCERYVIEKGEYLSAVIKDWRKKTDSIKEVFHEMMQDKSINKTGACVEWYKDDTEMFCMIKINSTD